MQKMCNDVEQRDSYSLRFVPDWFVTQEQLEIWHDGDDYCTGDEIIEWYKRHKKLRTQKAKIKEKLLLIAWHPSRWWELCMSEEEKSDSGKLWA